MKIKIENLKDSQRLIRIEVEAERVNTVLDDVYSDIQKRASIPGYRQGKAPRDIIETHYNKTANEEMLNHLIWDCYREAVIEQGLDPVGYPAIEDVNFDKGKPLIFTIRLDVRPEFKLKQYKGIKIKEKPCEIKDEDMGNSLKNLQESMAQYKNIEGRPVALGDYVICDYECFVDGKSVDKNDKLWLYISEQLQPKELSAVLLGTNAGVTKELEVNHPDNYQYKEVAGKKAFYRVTPKQIKEKLLPEINDDLAKSAGHFKDMQELKDNLREHLLNTKKLEVERNLKEQIFDNLLKSHSFPVPPSVVERQTTQLVENTKQRLLYQGYKKEDIDKQDESLKKNLAETAKKNVQLFFVLEKIAKEEKIEVAEKELDEKIAQIARNTKESIGEIKKKLEEKGLLENLKEQMEHDKVVEFLLKEAKKEVKG